MSKTKDIYLAGGCFWGLEEFMSSLDGVVDTEAVYAGGANESPTYEFHPGHAEAVHITFDPDKTSLKKILDLFFRVHDPTTLNRQGNDVGSSYRSALFYRDEAESKELEDLLESEKSSGFWHDEIVTTLEPLGNHARAEEYHQQYLKKNPGGYTCHYLRD
jgi:peptide-methionine (S)-S-oxide reductase